MLRNMILHKVYSSFYIIRHSEALLLMEITIAITIVKPQKSIPKYRLRRQKNTFYRLLELWWMQEKVLKSVIPFCVKKNPSQLMQRESIWEQKDKWHFYKYRPWKSKPTFLICWLIQIFGLKVSSHFFKNKAFVILLRTALKWYKYCILSRNECFYRIYKILFLINIFVLVLFLVNNNSSTFNYP